MAAAEKAPLSKVAHRWRTAASDSAAEMGGMDVGGVGVGKEGASEAAELMWAPQLCRCGRERQQGMARDDMGPGHGYVAGRKRDVAEQADDSGDSARGDENAILCGSSKVLPEDKRAGNAIELPRKLDPTMVFCSCSTESGTFRDTGRRL